MRSWKRFIALSSTGRLPHGEPPIPGRPDTGVIVGVPGRVPFRPARARNQTINRP